MSEIKTPTSPVALIKHYFELTGPEGRREILDLSKEEREELGGMIAEEYDFVPYRGGKYTRQ